MIQWLQDPSLFLPESVGGQPCMNVVIRCGLRVAGPDIQRDFWLQTGLDGTPWGWIMENGGRIWATLAKHAPKEAAKEMAQFLLSKGFDTLETDTTVAQATSLAAAPLAVMGCSQGENPVLPVSLQVQEGTLSQLTDIICQSGLLPTEQRESFYANRHLHWRRGTDRFFVATLGNQVVSSGALSYGGGREEAITCIATLPNFRGRGFAGALVQKLAFQSLASGHFPVLACRKELIPFYRQVRFDLLEDCSIVEYLQQIKIATNEDKGLTP